MLLPLFLSPKLSRGPTSPSIYHPLSPPFPASLQGLSQTAVLALVLTIFHADGLALPKSPSTLTLGGLTRLPCHLLLSTLLFVLLWIYCWLHMNAKRLWGSRPKPPANSSAGNAHPSVLHWPPPRYLLCGSLGCGEGRAYSAGGRQGCEVWGHEEDHG